MIKLHELADEVETARKKWLAASKAASQLANKLFQQGSGYGDPDARLQAEYRVQTARHDVDSLFQEYHDIYRHEMEMKMLEIHRSQRLATWASFAVVAVVGIATIISTVFTLLK